MSVSKGTLIRASSTRQAFARPHLRDRSNRNGIEDSALDHDESVLPSNGRLQRNAETFVQSAPSHLVRGLRNMRGVHRCAYT